MGAQQLTTSLKFQVGIAIISLLCLSIPLYKEIDPTTFTILDRLTDITSFSQEEYTARHKIKTGIIIQHFDTFDMLNNNFSLRAIIWFKFDPTIISPQDIEKFYIYQGTIVSKTLYSSQNLGSEKLVSYSLKIALTNPLNYKKFPFDDHRLCITINNNHISADQIMFVSTPQNIILQDKSAINGWLPLGKNIYTGYEQTTVGTKQEKIIDHPMLIFAIEYSRSGMRSAITILLPLFFIFLTAVFAFCMNPISYDFSLIALSTATVTALLSYRFVIDNLSPKVTVFLLCDYLFIIILFAVFIAFLVNMTSKQTPAIFKQTITILLHLLLVISTVYLLRFWGN